MVPRIFSRTRENKTKAIFEEIMTENFAKMIRHQDTDSRMSICSKQG